MVEVESFFTFGEDGDTREENLGREDSLVMCVLGGGRGGWSQLSCGP